MREGVGALIVQQQMILLGKRSAERDFYPDVWDVFGGHVEPGESDEQTLQRELYEELRIIPHRWEYLTTLAEPDPDQYGPGQYRFYLVTAWSGTPRNRQPREHVRVQWFALDQAVHLELAHPVYAGLFAGVLSRFMKEGSGHRLAVLFDGT